MAETKETEVPPTKADRKITTERDDDGEDENPKKKQRIEEPAAEEKEKPTTSQSPLEKKIFGSSFLGSGSSSAASPFSSLAKSAPVFGQNSATKVTFGTLASTPGEQNVFAKKDKDSATPTEDSTWVSPFSTNLFGAKAKEDAKQKPQDSASQHSTGEENERTDFSLRAKLYFFDSEKKKDWREKGIGTLKLNTSLETLKSRLVMRSDGNMRLILNVALFDGMVVELATDKSVRFTSIDNDKKMVAYLVRTRNKEEARDLLKAIKDKVSIVEPPKRQISDPFGKSAKDKENGQEEKNEKEEEPEKNGSQKEDESEVKGPKDAKEEEEEEEEENDDD